MVKLCVQRSLPYILFLPTFLLTPSYTGGLLPARSCSSRCGSGRQPQGHRPGGRPPAQAEPAPGLWGRPALKATSAAGPQAYDWGLRVKSRHDRCAPCSHNQVLASTGAPQLPTGCGSTRSRGYLYDFCCSALPGKQQQLFVGPCMREPLMLTPLRHDGNFKPPAAQGRAIGHRRATEQLAKGKPTARSVGGEVAALSCRYVGTAAGCSRGSRAAAYTQGGCPARFSIHIYLGEELPSSPCLGTLYAATKDAYRQNDYEAEGSLV